MAQLQVLCRPRLRFKFFNFFLCMCCVWMKRQLKHFESKYRNRNDVLIFESGSLGLKCLDQELKLIIHERFVLMAINILKKKFCGIGFVIRKKIIIEYLYVSHILLTSAISKRGISLL